MKRRDFVKTIAAGAAAWAVPACVMQQQDGPHESRNLACEPDQAERRKDMRGRCRQRAKKAGSLEK